MPLVALKNYKAAEVAAMLHGRAEGSGYLCRCPVPTHGKGRGDRRPSLGVSDGRRGVVFYCFAGCSHDQVAAAIENLAGARLPVACARWREAKNHVLLIAAMPGAHFESATDANSAGDRYAERHAQIANEAGIPFIRRRPPHEGADWNDVLKAQTFRRET
jgi:hypothetical protein